MSCDTSIHAIARPDAGRHLPSLLRVLMAVVAVTVAFFWSSTASASCGKYLYRNGKPVTDSSLSMDDPEENLALSKIPDGRPVSPCDGPDCSGNPIPLAPVPVAPMNLIRGLDQATLLDSLADPTLPLGAMGVPESERGARFVPSSIFRPPAA